MNCTGKRCLMQYNKVDPATCTAVSYCPQATPPKTNADRIRNMTDEELAEWIDNLLDAQGCPPKGIDNCTKFDECDKCWLKWLKEEVKDEHT